MHETDGEQQTKKKRKESPRDCMRVRKIQANRATNRPAYTFGQKLSKVPKHLHGSDTLSVTNDEGTLPLRFSLHPRYPCLWSPAPHAKAPGLQHQTYRQVGILKAVSF